MTAAHEPLPGLPGGIGEALKPMFEGMERAREDRTREIVREELAAYDERRRQEINARHHELKVEQAERMTTSPPMRYQRDTGWEIDIEQLNTVRASAGLAPLAAADLELKLAQRIADANKDLADSVGVSGGITVSDDPRDIPAELGGDRSGIVIVGTEEREHGAERHDTSPSTGADTPNSEGAGWPAPGNQLPGGSARAHTKGGTR